MLSFSSQHASVVVDDITHWLLNLKCNSAILNFFPHEIGFFKIGQFLFEKESWLAFSIFFAFLSHQYLKPLKTPSPYLDFKLLYVFNQLLLQAFLSMSNWCF